MAIPDYQSVMLPLLRFTSDQKEHHIREAINYLPQVFNLSEQERRELLPSGNDVIFDNRVKWARLYMGKAGLLESTRRGFIRITERGLQVLMGNPARIDFKFLEQYPEFIEWKSIPTKPRTRVPIDYTEGVSKQTPEESVEYGYQQLRGDLVLQLLTQVKDASPGFFEKLVVDLLLGMGYGGSRKDAGEIRGKRGDEGIDGVIKEDRLGLDVIYIQAKRWADASVGRPDLQKFVGALKGQQANKGIFITTSKFSDEAIDYVARIDSKIVLIDGEQLAELMIDHDIGVSTVTSYEIKKVDSDYFVED